MSLMTFAGGCEKRSGNEDPAVYWDLEQLKAPPVFREDHDPVCSHPTLRSIIFDGVKENGVTTQVFAYIAIPDGPIPDGGFPGIVLVHGGGGSAFVWAAELYRSYGYAVIVPDWYGNRPTEIDKTEDNGRQQRIPLVHSRDVAFDGKDEHIVNAANLILAHSLLRSLPEVDPEKIIYIGLSWGSYYGAMITAVDNRFCGIIEIYLGDRKDTEQFINGRFLHAAKVPMYYVVGTNDVHASPESLQAGFDACGSKLGNRTMIVELPHGHSGFRLQACRRYADMLLKNKENLPLLAKSVTDSGRISAEILDPGKGIKKAFLCFTDSRESVLHERKWQMIPAQIQDNTLNASLPDGVKACFLAAFDEEVPDGSCCGTGDVITFE